MEQFFNEILEIFFGMTTCLEVTIFLGITNSLKVIFLSEMTIFLIGVTCFIGSTCIKGADIEDANTEDAGIESSCIERVYTKSIYFDDACISSTDIIKYLKIHL